MYIAATADMRLEIIFEMTVDRIQANPHIYEDCGRTAIMRGPIVYCAEGVDNGENLKDLRLANDLAPEITQDPLYHCPTLRINAWRRAEFESLYSAEPVALQSIRIRLIPYFAFANRGTTEMIVWMLNAQ